MTTEAPLLAQNVGVSIGSRQILDGVSLQAASGRVTALLGSNGAGKTTFIRCCTGLMAFTGEIRIVGTSPGGPAALARVGVMPQQTGAWSGITARELLTYLGRLYAHPHPVPELISHLGIEPFASTPYRRLSGGQQQAVNLAGALVGRPSLVFLDEPTAGLDVRVRRATWDLVRQVRDAGVAVVLTTHDMHEAEELADDVVILDAGRVTARGSLAELTREAPLEDVFLARTCGGGS